MSTVAEIERDLYIKFIRTVCEDINDMHMSNELMVHFKDMLELGMDVIPLAAKKGGLGEIERGVN